MFTRRLFSLACFTVSLLWLAVSVVCLLNLPQSKAYLIDIFSAPLLTGAIICLGLLILMKQRLSALIGLVAVAVLSLSLWGQIFPQQPKPDLTAQPVRLVFANLWIRNQTPEKLIAWIERENADVVALVEVGPLAEAKLIAPLKTRLPYVTHHHQTTLLSRFPISATASSHIGYSTATATIDAPSGPLHLAVVHMTRPWPFTAHDAQPQQVRQLAQDVSTRQSERTVLVGDFNSTPSARALSHFSRTTGFSPAGSGNGTWPATLPAPLRLGIDNVFAAKGLSLKSRRTGPYYGSDHRPVRVDIYPAISE